LAFLVGAALVLHPIPGAAQTPTPNSPRKPIPGGARNGSRQPVLSGTPTPGVADDATRQPAASEPATASRPAARKSGAGMVTLNLDNADMYDFINQMSSILGLSPVLLDPAVTGSVSLIAPGPMSRDDAFSLFNLILKSRSAALVNNQGVYQVVPLSSALRNDLELIDHLPDDASPGAASAPVVQPPAPDRKPDDAKGAPLATHVIRVEFVPVKDLVEPVKLFATEGVSILAYERLNMLIFTDYAASAAKIQELVRMLDKSFLDPELVELVKIEYNAAADVADDLKQIFGSGSGDSSATGIAFLPLERLNAIFVMASTKRGLAEAKRWIKDLDTNASNKFQTFVYVVQNSTASNIAMMISALYGGDSSGSDLSASSGGLGGGVGGGTSQNGRNSQGVGSSSSGSRFGSSSSLSSSGSMFGSQGSGSSYSDYGYGSGGGTFGSGSSLGPQLNTGARSVTSIILKGGTFSGLRDVVRVVVDDINNSLIIQSTPADYRYILGTIEKMDVLPRQAIIDAQIYEVDLTSELSYGLRGMLEGRTEDNLTTAGVSDSGLLSGSTFAYVGNSRQLMLALDALKTKTNVKVLEHPSLHAMDGTPSYIMVGAEVPYPAGGYTASSGGYTSSVSYRNTGIYLSVLPRISASGMVTLEISQEVSNFGADLSIGDASAPVFPKTSVETTLSVRDGETVAIAGLIRDQNKWGRGGVPILSDIPVVGGLFGATTRNKTRTELIILITPHVIRTPDKFQETTQELKDSLRNVRKMADDVEDERIEDMEDARKDREKKELSNIKKVKPPQQK
jgi:general secretion pathway protein D